LHNTLQGTITNECFVIFAESCERNSNSHATRRIKAFTYKSNIVFKLLNMFLLYVLNRGARIWFSKL